MKKIIIVVLVALIFIFGWYFLRGESITQLKSIEKNDSFDIYKLVFKGDDGKEIYALLFAPNKEKFDVVIVLPGGGGTKESRKWYGILLLDRGYGSLILDQRGIGETQGYVNSLQEDFEAFLSGEEAHQLLMAKDVVKAAESLENFKEVRKIAVLGESMGGRNAIIAAALDERIEGVVVISSAGHRGSTGDIQGDRFLAFINPNSYVGKIASRRLLMLHAVNDSVVPFEDARYTFSLAGEPKKFVDFEEPECSHGYCDPMRKALEEELALIFR